MKKWWFRLVLSLGLLPAMGTNGSAWDTLNDFNGWESLYINTGSYALGTNNSKSFRQNEHALIADDVLFNIDKSIGERFGVQSCSPTYGDNCPIIVDLNAALERPTLSKLAKHGDVPGTLLEERMLPALAMWAGLPDMNYTVYHWINKGEYCPSLPRNADYYDFCSEYSAWMGAVLNSTHMGELARKVYARHHKIALNLAEKASKMRTLFDEGGKLKKLDDGSSLHSDYIQELERLALIYETTGQHFLQDRWAIGHMFSRWGSGRYDDLPMDRSTGKRSFTSGMIAGLVTGIVHGTLAISGKPDPLSNPLFDLKRPLIKSKTLLKRKVKVMTWRFSNDKSNIYNGVGDLLYRDLRDKTFGKEFGIADVDLKVNHQEMALLYCSEEGYRQIIAAFGMKGETYGSLELPLSEPKSNQSGFLPKANLEGSDPSVRGEMCTDAWVTNDSFYDGARTMAGIGDISGVLAILSAKSKIEKKAFPPPSIPSGIVAVLKRNFHLEKDSHPPTTPTPSMLRLGAYLTTVRYKALRNKGIRKKGPNVREKKYGIESAKDGITIDKRVLTTEKGKILPVLGEFSFRPNTNYEIPDYYEPENLDDLLKKEEIDFEHGKDKSALAGFFNKAFTEYWCTDHYTKLKQVRDRAQDWPPSASGKLKEKDIAICCYLANRSYKGTDPAYPKPDNENDPDSRYERIGNFPPHSNKKTTGAIFEPVCAYFDENSGDDDKTSGVRVADDSDDDRIYYIHPGYVDKPGKKGSLGYSGQTIENWCRRIPVIDMTTFGGDNNRVDLSRDSGGTRTIKLTGRNFGSKKGQVTLDGSIVFKSDNITTWTENEITFRYTDGENGGLQENKIYQLSLKRADGVGTVGKYTLLPIDTILPDAPKNLKIS